MNGVVAMRRFAGVGLLLLAVGVSPVAAHHGWSSYDSTKELTLTGSIKEAGIASCGVECPTGVTEIAR